MISMIYMPGLHTCLLLERWIAGSLDHWIARSHRFAACAAALTITLPFWYT
ncbi:MAG: hypothetical protein ACLT4O_05815 [Clostridia bacterium]